MITKSQIPNPKSQEGFTLIELVVVFTVIAILSTIGTVSFVSYSRSQTLNQAANDLMQTLNTAKSLSGSQLKILSKNGISWQCQDSQTLNGYGVLISTTNRYYSLYIECIRGEVKTQYPDPGSSNDWRTPLPNSVSFDASSTNITNVFFPILSGGIISNGDSIVLSSYGNMKTIRVGNGYISILQ
jgi:prepilin-type N-terminal cleavage/methylation domain-containing protein